jgi:ABC-2 type transport system ATP-binding protein
MLDEILVVDKVSKRYSTCTSALSNVSMTVRQGEIFALLGANGAGKTTLVGVLTGMVRKSEGRVRIFGIDLDHDPIAPRYSIGVVPQELGFESFLTVRDILGLQLGYYGKRIEKERIDEVLDAVSLRDKADAEIRALSGGMKRRLAIAKALVHKPRLLFLDEPTAGVDSEQRRDLWHYVLRLRSEGMTVVLTTHYLEEAEQLADRVAILDKGQLLTVESKVALLARLGERTLTVTFPTALARLPESVPGALSTCGRKLLFVERANSMSVSDVLKSLFGAGLAVVDVQVAAARLDQVVDHVVAKGAA